MFRHGSYYIVRFVSAFISTKDQKERADRVLPIIFDLKKVHFPIVSFPNCGYAL